MKDWQKTIALIDVMAQATDPNERLSARVVLFNHIQTLHAQIDQLRQCVADQYSNHFYAVLNPVGNEGVVFRDKANAEFALRGKVPPIMQGTPTIAIKFRDLYASSQYGVLDGISLAIVRKPWTGDVS